MTDLEFESLRPSGEDLSSLSLLSPNETHTRVDCLLCQATFSRREIVKHLAKSHGGVFNDQALKRLIIDKDAKCLKQSKQQFLTKGSFFNMACERKRREMPTDSGSVPVDDDGETYRALCDQSDEDANVTDVTSGSEDANRESSVEPNEPEVEDKTAVTVGLVHFL